MITINLMGLKIVYGCFKNLTSYQLNQITISLVLIFQIFFTYFLTFESLLN